MIKELILDLETKLSDIDAKRNFKIESISTHYELNLKLINEKFSAQVNAANSIEEQRDKLLNKIHKLRDDQLSEAKNLLNEHKKLDELKAKIANEYRYFKPCKYFHNDTLLPKHKLQSSLSLKQNIKYAFLIKLNKRIDLAAKKIVLKGNEDFTYNIKINNNHFEHRFTLIKVNRIFVSAKIDDCTQMLILNNQADILYSHKIKILNDTQCQYFHCADSYIVRQIEDFGENRFKNNKIEIYDFKLNLLRSLKGERSFHLREYITNANEMAFIHKEIIYVYNIDNDTNSQIEYPIKDLKLGYLNLIHLNNEYFYFFQYLESINMMSLAIWSRSPSLTNIASIYVSMESHKTIKFDDRNGRIYALANEDYEDYIRVINIYEMNGKLVDKFIMENQYMDLFKSMHFTKFDQIIFNMVSTKDFIDFDEI